MPIPIPVELDRCAPGVTGDFLSSTCPLPEGWERGISFQDTSCLTPTVMGECPACPPGLKDAQTAGTETFRPVSLISAVECSTFGGVDVQMVADEIITLTSGYALAREMLTGEAARRDANPRAQGDQFNPSLQGNALNIGDAFADPFEAFGCLEQAIADTTGGRRGYILIGPEIAMQLMPYLYREGGRLYTPAGTRVVVDAGFDGRAPGEISPGDESPGDCIPWNTTGAPQMGDQLYIYATSSIWAGVGGLGTRQMLSDVDRQNNTARARDERIALAAFTPCSTFAAGSGVTKACGSFINSPGPIPAP